MPVVLLPLLLGFQQLPSRYPPLATLPFDAQRATSLRGEWAKALGVEEEFTNAIGMKLVLIPPGRFDMGPNGSKHRVTLAKPFWIGTTEVTLAQYRSWKPGHQVAGAEAEFNEGHRPAALVSWEDAQQFCVWLSEQPAEKAAGRVYTLPTEAQWEWAARAGTTTTRHFGDTDKEQAQFAQFNHTYTPNPKHESQGRGRQAVGKLKPNAWGLFDTLGNVWEWCADRHDDPLTGESRQPVMRGGSWRSGAFHCTSAACDPGDPKLRADNIGFRLVCRRAAASR